MSFDHDMAGRSYIVHVEPLRDAQGAIRGTVGIALDVTNQRRADQALRVSEARLRQVINLVPHFIFGEYPDGRFLLANRAVAEAYGTTVDRLIGRTDADFARSAEEVETFRHDDLEVMRTGDARLIDERITDSRGGLRYLQTTKIPFTFSGTKRPAVLGVSIDVTERRAAEETLTFAARRRRRASPSSPGGHDFNNLLAAILGHAALALKQLPAGGAVRRHVEKAAAAVEPRRPTSRARCSRTPAAATFEVRADSTSPPRVRENQPAPVELALPEERARS